MKIKLSETERETVKILANSAAYFLKRYHTRVSDLARGINWGQYIAYKDSAKAVVKMLAHHD